MKKGIIVLLIAVLVSGFAFAKFSGDAGVRIDALLGDDFGVLTTNEKSFDFSFEFASEKVEIAGDEDVHVEVAASAKFILGEYNDTVSFEGNGNWIITQTGLDDRGIGAVIKLDTAKIVGKDWYVSVLGAQDAYDYAKAAVLQINSKKVKDDFGNVKRIDDQAASYKVDYNKLDGVTVGFKGFTASAGFDYVKDENNDSLLAASATIETPEFAFSDDAVKVQAAAEFSRFSISADPLTIKDNVFGASAKATVAIQDITVKAAVDMGLENVGAEYEGQTEKDTEFNVDARVDFKYDFVDVNIYTFAGKTVLKSTDGNYKDFYLEAQAAFDLNAFELPLKVTVSAKNITNAEKEAVPEPIKAGIVPAINVEYAQDAIKAAASFDMNTETKAWNALVYGTYAFEKFTAGAGLKLDGKDELKTIAFAAFAETTKLVNGATFGFAYGLDSGKVYSDGCAAALSTASKYKANFKADPIVAGNAVAYCKIAF